MKRLGVLFLAFMMLLSVTGTSMAASPGLGARAMGMGGAFTAVADDGTAAYWNPAGITQVRFALTPTFGVVGDMKGLQDIMDQVKKFETVQNYNELENLNIGDINLGLNAGLGLNFSGFALNAFVDSSFGTPGLNKDTGSLDGYAAGNLALTFAREFTELVGVGVNLKYVYLARSVADYKLTSYTFEYQSQKATVDLPQGQLKYGAGSGWACDLGGMFKVSDTLRVAAVLRNINLGGVKLTGTKSKTDFGSIDRELVNYVDEYGTADGFEDYLLNKGVPIVDEDLSETYHLPTTLALGGAFKVPVTGTLLAADYALPFSGGENGTFRVGLEQPLLWLFFIRLGGYTVDGGFNYTAGLGGKLGPVLVDVAAILGDEKTSAGAYLTLGFKF